MSKVIRMFFKKRFLFPRVECQHVTRRVIQSCLERVKRDQQLSLRGNRVKKAYHSGRRESLEAIQTVLEDAWERMDW